MDPNVAWPMRLTTNIEFILQKNGFGLNGSSKIFKDRIGETVLVGIWSYYIYLVRFYNAASSMLRI